MDPLESLRETLFRSFDADGAADASTEDEFRAIFSQAGFRSRRDAAVAATPPRAPLDDEREREEMAHRWWRNACVVRVFFRWKSETRERKAKQEIRRLADMQYRCCHALQAVRRWRAVTERSATLAAVSDERKLHLKSSFCPLLQAMHFL